MALETMKMKSLRTLPVRAKMPSRQLARDQWANHIDC